MTVEEFWERSSPVKIFLVHWKGLYKQFVSPNELTFDIGAERGLRTNALRHVGAHVVAVEPLVKLKPEWVRELTWKFNEDPHVTIVPKAVSDRIGTASFMLNPYMPDMSSMSWPFMTESVHKSFYNQQQCIKTTVETTTLDALIEEFGTPVFIKLDVEGYEDVVIKGLSRSIRAFAMEFHQDWLASNANCMRHMDALDLYEYNYVFNNQSDFRSQHWVSGDVLLSHLTEKLSVRGDWSWGDIYGRRANVKWPLN